MTDTVDINVKSKKSQRAKILDTVLTVVIILMAVFLLINIIFIGKYVVSGSSMEPTLYEDTNLWGWKYSKPKYNNIVVVDMRGKDYNDIDATSDYLYIKRVIALGGDKLWEQDGILYILRSDGTQITDDSPYTTNKGFYGTSRDNPIIVEEGFMFLMGDNRRASHDSRDFGQIEVSRLVAVIMGVK